MNILTSTIFLVLVGVGSSTLAQGDKLYFGLEAPTSEPVVFAPDLISLPDRNEFGSTFSKDGKEFYFAVDFDGRNEIYFSELIAGEWTKPMVILKHEAYGYNDPMLDPDENRLYFISNQPLSGSGKEKDIDIWYVERQGESWSDPVNAGPTINSEKNEYYISFAADGSMYFASNILTSEERYWDYEIYRSQLKAGAFQKAEILPEEINTGRYEADVYVAPDESYLIYCAARADSYGKGDLYINFKDEEGNWLPSQHIGAPVSTESHDLCPFVTADGKYLFYTSSQDIYWVSTEVLEQYRPEK
ncbi:MAG: hypothetical protein AAF655_01195 [Bacteroidota bacterium]